MNLSTYASGHLRRYKTDEEEIGVLEREEARRRRGGIGTFDPENSQEHWWPSSLDFKEEAVRRGPAIAVRSFMQSGEEEANRFEGPTKTHFPFGPTLKTWTEHVFSRCQW